LSKFSTISHPMRLSTLTARIGHLEYNMSGSVVVGDPIDLG